MADSKWQQYDIFPSLDGQTLGAVVKILLKEASWSKAKQAISSRRVQVNGNLCLDEARRVKRGDKVRIYQQSLAPLPSAEKLIIRYQDDHLLIVEKPAGIVSTRHLEEEDLSPTRKEKQPTLEELLAKSLEKNSSRQKNMRGGKQTAASPLRAVHRLDRDTSGLMVFALSNQAYNALVQLFAQHNIQRKYRTVVHGICPAMTCQSHFVRDRGDGKRGSHTGPTPPPPDSKRAVTHVTPIKTFFTQGNIPLSIVECTLETGRTHQIRIHLSEAGHSVCGDKIYKSSAASDLQISAVPMPPRQVLHAAVLGFDHPITGKPMHWESDWPKDLKNWLDRISAGK